jgi:hypothetical protein
MATEAVQNDRNSAKVVQNERTATDQKLTRQPDGPGKRIGKKGEISGIGKVAPGGAKIFRDFKPYIKDILKEAGPWLDQIFVGVWDGFKGSNDAESVERLLSLAVEAELFFVANPDVTVRDVAKMHRLSIAVNEILDAAS